MSVGPFRTVSKTHLSPDYIRLQWIDLYLRFAIHSPPVTFNSGYCELSVPTMAELFTDADDAYFLMYTFKQKLRPADIFT